jgi:glycerol 3-phosphatase-1
MAAPSVKIRAPEYHDFDALVRIPLARLNQHHWLTNRVRQLFDMDGTIIDSTPAIIKYWLQMGKDIGVDGNGMSRKDLHRHASER